MTLTGKVFAGYAEAIVKAHGFGSPKMVRLHGTDDWEKISWDLKDADRERRKDVYATLDELSEACERYEKISETIREMNRAVMWLIENGYLRENNWGFYSKSYHNSPKMAGTSIGLTDKGWAVASKYLAAKK